ncbi:MAG: SRPBCC family protein [Solirubrobacterales bacterium]|nr:SRPBCC family protein [Solirubrobacterales bacterium]
MAKVVARASGAVEAPPERVLAFLRDYREARPRILTSNYTAYRVEEGGDGAGTVITYNFKAGGRERDYRLRVQESDGALEERDELSSFVSTWTVSASGAGSDVTLESSWDGAGGIGGFFERTFAPRSLGRIFGEMLARLAAAVSGSS